jgi:hypothetical protein
MKLSRQVCFFCAPAQVLSPEYASRAAALAAAAAARHDGTHVDLEQQPTTPAASSRQSEVCNAERAPAATMYPEPCLARHELHELFMGGGGPVVSACILRPTLTVMCRQ